MLYFFGFVSVRFGQGKNTFQWAVFRGRRMMTTNLKKAPGACKGKITLNIP